MSLLFSFFAALFRAAVAGGRQSKNPRSIVIIRLDQIGDFFLWLPWAKALRRHFKDEHITLVVNEELLETAQTFLDFDRYIPVAPKRFLTEAKYRRKIRKAVRMRTYDIAVNPRISRYILLDDLIQLWCRAGRNYVFGYTPDQAYHPRIQFCQKLVDRLWTTIPQHLIHELENNACFTKAIIPEAEAEPDFYLRPPPSPPGLPAHYFVLCPGAGRPYRQWNRENFATVARHLCETHIGMHCVICGSAADEETAKYILSQLPAGCGLSLCGRTSIPEFAGVLQKAQLVIGNDTGGIHIAAAVGTPAVALVGGGGWERFLPYPERFSPFLSLPYAVTGTICREACTWICPHAEDDRVPRPCIESIAVEEVVQAAETILSQRQNQN